MEAMKRENADLKNERDVLEEKLFQEGINVDQERTMRISETDRIKLDFEKQKVRAEIAEKVSYSRNHELEAIGRELAAQKESMEQERVAQRMSADRLRSDLVEQKKKTDDAVKEIESLKGETEKAKL